MRRKVYAVWVSPGGAELLLFPRGKHNYFNSVALAARALERQGQRYGENSRGLVKDAQTGEVVLTIAL